MTEELKPCPFCGGEVKWREYSLFAKRIAIEKGLPLVPMIRCESCGAMVSFDPIEDPEPNYKKEAAGTLWNTRRERIVRCKDCDYCDDSDCWEHGAMFCLHSGLFFDDTDGFCAWGERR